MAERTLYSMSEWLRRDIHAAIDHEFSRWLQINRGTVIEGGDWRCYVCGQVVPKVFIVADVMVYPPKVCCLECYTFTPLAQRRTDG